VHSIRPAKLKSGVTADDLPAASQPATEGSRALIQGKALIFWDPKQTGKKLDAIDTDQKIVDIVAI